MAIPASPLFRVLCRKESLHKYHNASSMLQTAPIPTFGPFLPLQVEIQGLIGGRAASLSAASNSKICCKEGHLVLVPATRTWRSRSRSAWLGNGMNIVVGTNLCDARLCYCRRSCCGRVRGL
ncbi:hypothetical protein B0H19DRAFT_85472 [Mycena capillaripes]|nr:hypothetical protein B0H19DRAFT_85472 [Mycena capillaripes]